MNFLKSLETSASGLSVQRKRMDIIASNLANIETTRTDKGGPYRRKMVVMRTKEMDQDFNEMFNSSVKGVQIDEIVEDQAPFKRVYNPSHPDADSDGYLSKPNVDLIVETTNMLMARRAFEANIAAIKATRQMVIKALEIGR
ncbi:MAG: flagellar basal body rod protein FlgC [Desulfobacteraceae bacterium]|jgi:flagellar basal-body rod protein FlgC|nr:flagellar basal body rod protein FlgC [Desulfobacteraceae bacterium]MDH3720083.1 flagellar basal body rod protein FlgC [Desulfobacteraceae bacterium]MDH3836562.1 flagellar basal body rod protein FlgC [Desulfobacteraceae bacterium]MDH3874121.1 flagellar basal body rod protein FlgC [Desulfobacteraceae bacterium]MDH3955173.1 flagellar basal body rod protein FlgC [Desulfobacteraceae bacterium]